MITENYHPATKNVHGIWRNDRYDLSSGPDMARYVARMRYAWPGGYEMFAITSDGSILCHNCCYSEYYYIRTADINDGWDVVAISSAQETEEPEYCSHCNKKID